MIRLEENLTHGEGIKNLQSGKMRKLILSVNVTLDGFMAGPGKELDWHFENWNEEMKDFAVSQLEAVDTILLGKSSYEGMAKYWPAEAIDLTAKKRDIQFARRMNELPKIVFSTTLKQVTWTNARLAKKNMVEEVSALKKKPGGDIIVWGGVGIAQSCILHHLVDEYRIWIAPVAIGNGIPLFNIRNNLDLKLLQTKTFSNGVVLLCFASAKNHAHGGLYVV